MNRNLLLDTYKTFYSKKKRRPKSVREFCTFSKIERKDFKSHYKSLFGIERDIWELFALESIQRISTAPEYEQFSAQEKLLAFYYTFLELVKQDADFVKINLQRMSKTAFISDYTDKLRKAFCRFAENILEEAAETEEIKNRPLIFAQYPKFFWLQLMAILNYWKNDKSTDNELTDAFIEKSVQLSFDLVSKGPIDSAFDLG
ncbi:MAG: TetR family transcriptional regulator C-terminal domain-containing protein, partial [Chitinophagales bacterium]